MSLEDMVEEMSEEKLDRAIEQIEASIEKLGL